MRFSSFVCAFLTTGCALVHPSLAYNSRSCDDLSHLKPNCPHEECHAPNVQALHHGCYVCVDPETCRSPMTLPLAPASNEARETIALSSAQNDHAGEKGIEVFPEHAADEAVVAPATPVNIQGVSNVYFLIPACLALVSVGLALRNRMVIADIEFERVDGDDHDELNPFCTDARCNPQHDEGDLEYGDPKDGEDE